MARPVLSCISGCGCVYQSWSCCINKSSPSRPLYAVWLARTLAGENLVVSAGDRVRFFLLSGVSPPAPHHTPPTPSGATRAELAAATEKLKALQRQKTSNQNTAFVQAIEEAKALDLAKDAVSGSFWTTTTPDSPLLRPPTSGGSVDGAAGNRAPEPFRLLHTARSLHSRDVHCVRVLTDYRGLPSTLLSASEDGQIAVSTFRLGRV